MLHFVCKQTNCQKYNRQQGNTLSISVVNDHTPKLAKHETLTLVRDQFRLSPTVKPVLNGFPVTQTWGGRCVLLARQYVGTFKLETKIGHL